MNRKMVRIPIKDDSGVAWSIIEARNFAAELGFEEHDRQMIGTAVSELARNIVKYADRGNILLQEAADGKRRGIEICARDRGPGIEDLDRAMADSFSSGGTLGLGLPGVKRMMDFFEIKTEIGRGTTVFARKWR
jgi:serine/threonine-protein kinase RsbT